MVSHYCSNSPAGGSEGSADLGRALPDEQDCEKCGSSKAKQPYSYLDFSRRFHRLSETIRARVRRCAYPKASRSTLSSVRSAQETLHRRLRLFDAHQNRFANKGHVRSQDHASSQRLARNQTKRQPKNAENDCRQYVRQKMCAQSDTAESNQGDQQCRASDCQPPPVARLHSWENKKSEL